MSVVQQFLQCEEKIQSVFNDCHLLHRDINIVAVSKYHNINTILPLIEHGHRLFGENKLQEAHLKWPALKVQYPDLKLHMIGPIQSNKLFACCDLFDVIETIDRIKLIDKLVLYREKNNILPDVFLQVNIGNEAQKSGCSIKEIPSILEYALHRNIIFKGMMCIPPRHKFPIIYFSQMKYLSQKYGIPITSMGMSQDFEQAIMVGSDYVRIGSKIFTTN